MQSLDELRRALAMRLAQERQAITRDEIPLPIGGPLRFNPLRNVPVVGGALNVAANIPLHTAGLLGEAGGNVARPLTGAVLAQTGRALDLPGVGGVLQNPQARLAAQALVPGVGAFVQALGMPGMIAAARAAREAQDRDTGDPIQRALAAETAGSEKSPLVGMLMNTVYNPLSWVAPAAKAADVANLPRLASLLRGADVAQSLPFSGGQAARGLRGLVGPKPAEPVAQLAANLSPAALRAPLARIGTSTVGGAGAGAAAFGQGEVQKRQREDGTWVDLFGQPTTPPDKAAMLKGALIGGVLGAGFGAAKGRPALAAKALPAVKPETQALLDNAVHAMGVGADDLLGAGLSPTVPLQGKVRASPLRGDGGFLVQGLEQAAAAARALPGFNPSGFPADPRLEAEIVGAARVMARGLSRREYVREMGRDYPQLKPAQLSALYDESVGVISSFAGQLAATDRPTLTRMASLVRQGMAKNPEALDWYEGVLENLHNLVGSDAPIMMELLAVTSPRTNVDRNVTEALQALIEYRTGHAPGELFDYTVGGSKLPAMRKAFAGQQWGDLKTQDFVNSFYESYVAKHPDADFPAGTWQRFKEIWGANPQPTAVTSDTWHMRGLGYSVPPQTQGEMQVGLERLASYPGQGKVKRKSASIARRMLGENVLQGREIPEQYTPKLGIPVNEFAPINQSDTMYKYLKALGQEAATRLTDDLGREVTPRQAQAALWFGAKHDWVERGFARPDATRGGRFDTLLADLLGDDPQKTIQRVLANRIRHPDVTQIITMRNRGLLGAGLAPDYFDDMDPSQRNFVDELFAVFRRGDPKEMQATEAFATDVMEIPAAKVRQAFDAAAEEVDTEDVAARLQAIEQSPYFQAFPYFNRQGQLKKVNPQTGARLTVRDRGKIVQGRDEVWNIPGSGYDEVADSILARFQDEGHNQNFGQTADDFWRGARDAYQEYRALKNPRPATAGIPSTPPAATVAAPPTVAPVPPPVVPAQAAPAAVAPPPALPAVAPATAPPAPPLPPASPPTMPSPGGGFPATRALRAGLGGVAGGLVGGQQGDTPEERGGNALRGAAIGALGAGIGPEVGKALYQVATDFPGAIEDTLLDPKTLRLIKRQADAAQAASKTAPGAKLAELPRAIDDFWRRQVVNTLRGLGLDAASLWTLVADWGRDYGVDRAMVRGRFGELVDHFDDADPVDRLGGLGQVLKAWGLDRMIDKETGVESAIGTGFLDQAGRARPGEAQLSAPQRAITGAALSFANLREALIPIAGPAWGAFRGHMAPWVNAAYGTANGLQHAAARTTFWEAALDRELPAAAARFADELLPTGVDLSPLLASGRTVNRGQLETFLKGQYKGLTPAEVTSIGDAFDNALETTAKAEGDKIAKIFGDFREGQQGAWKTFLGRIFPFSNYAMTMLPTYARMIKRNPGKVAAIGGAAALSAAATRNNDEPPWNAGTVPISTETPGLGALARLRLGGQQGTVRVSPLNLLGGPIGADQLAGMRDLPDDASAYDKAKAALDLIGMPGPHPVIDYAAREAGLTRDLPQPLSRTAGIEQAAELLPGMPMLPTAQGPSNAIVGATTGQTPDDYDAVARRYALLVQAKTQKSLDDPANRPYLVGLGDPENPLWQQAQREVRLAGLVGGVVSNTLPLSNTATSTETEAAGAARAAALAIPANPYAGREGRYSGGSDPTLGVRLAASYAARHPGALPVGANPPSPYRGASTAGRERLLADTRGSFVTNPAVTRLLQERLRQEYQRRDR